MDNIEANCYEVRITKTVHVTTDNPTRAVELAMEYARDASVCEVTIRKES